MRNLFNTILFLSFTLCSFVYTQAQDSGEFGLASYYSDSFQGKVTAYGVKYDKNQLTAAHKLHPYGTLLKVTRLDNQKSVTVKVIDKGPYIKGRVVDLSRAAAERLGIIQDGIAEVKVDVVGAAKKETTASKSSQPKPKSPTSYDDTPTRRIASNTQTAEKKEAPVKKATNTSSTSSKKSTDTAKSTTSKKTTTKAADTPKARLVGKEFQQYGVYKISIQKPEAGNYGVQVASLVNYENVFRQVADLQERSFDDILISIEEGKDQPMYKVILGPFESEAGAENYRKNLASRYKIKGFVVTLDEEEEDK